MKFAFVINAALSAVNIGFFAWTKQPISIVAAAFCGLTAVYFAICIATGDR